MAQCKTLRTICKSLYDNLISVDFPSEMMTSKIASSRGAAVSYGNALSFSPIDRPAK
jgi:hypothetical protein